MAKMLISVKFRRRGDRDRVRINSDPHPITPQPTLTHSQHTCHGQIKQVRLSLRWNMKPCCKALNYLAEARQIPTHQLGWVGGKRWRRNLEAELEESEGSARLSSNAGSNAGVAVGPLCIPRPRSRGRGSARFRAHVTHRASQHKVGPNPRATTRVA